MTGISLTAYRNFLQYKGWQALDPEPEHLDVIQQLAKVKESVLARLGVDVRGLFPAPPLAWQATYQEVGEYLQFIDEWGISWRKPKKGGFYFDMTGHPLPGSVTLREIAGYNWPDPLDPGRTVQIKAQLEEIKGYGDFGITLHGFCAGIMEMAMRLRGFDQFFMDLALVPDLACGLLDRIVELKQAYWAHVLSIVGDEISVVVEADDLGTQESLLISPEMYRKYLKPRQQRIFAFIKQKAPHVRVFLHSCGAIQPLIPDLIEAGVDILNPVQVAAKGMNPRQLKRLFGSVLTFWGGGVDTQSVLPYGSPQMVKDEVAKRIEDLAPGGGFVFNTIHNIQADVPPANLEAMFETLSLYRVGSGRSLIA